MCLFLFYFRVSGVCFMVVSRREEKGREGKGKEGKGRSCMFVFFFLALKEFSSLYEIT